MAHLPSKDSQDKTRSIIKPIIEELVRTQFCFPDIVLLVDRVIIAKVSTDKDSGNVEAYRLYLTDKEKSIQAVLRRRLHKRVVQDGLREGSHIVLKDYRLATGRRLNGSGNIRYISISDFYIVGQETRHEVPIVESESSAVSKQPPRAVSDLLIEYLSEVLDERKQDDIASTEKASTLVNDGVVKHQSRSHDGQDGEIRILRDRQPNTHLARVPSLETAGSNEDAFESRATEKKRKRNLEASRTDLELDSATRAIPTKKLQTGSRFKEDTKPPVSCPSESPWARKAKTAGTSLQQVERPLRLSTLASVTGVNRSRNKVVDILALIDSVDESTVKPVHLPLKRDVRITDSSLDRKVTVSIFVDPVDCIPVAGQIVLFRNLVTHDWKQGALNAYPKYCDGKNWYIPDPERVESQHYDWKKLKADILAAEEERRNAIGTGDG